MKRGMILPLALVAILVGCGRPTESPSPSFSLGDVGATYALSAVDGQSLPALAYFGVDVAVRANSGTLTLAADHSYSLTVAYTQHMASGNRDRTFSQGERGTWRATARGVELQTEGGTIRQATGAGDALTVSFTVADASPPERATKGYGFVRVR